MISTGSTFMTNPRFRAIIADNVIFPMSGSNPVDSSPVELKNIRGQLIIQGMAGDSGVVWSFELRGNFYGVSDATYSVLTNTFANCRVETIQPNQFRIITIPADSGGRIYDLVFSSYIGAAPTIYQLSVNVLGNNYLNIKMAKSSIFH